MSGLLEDTIQEVKDGFQGKGKEGTVGKKKRAASEGGEQSRQKRLKETKHKETGSQDKGEGGGGMLTYADVC